MSGKLTIWLMRHGETYLNKYMRMQGWSNAPLTPEGIKDCTASGRGLARIKFDAVYTSDLQRTKDTAELVMAENSISMQVPFVAKKEFREIFFGVFESLPVSDVWPKIREAAEKYYGVSDTHQALLNTMHALDDTKDAEDYMSAWLRVEKGLVSVLQKHAQTNDNILIVCHGLLIKIMLEALVPDFQVDASLKNASVTKIIYEKGQFHLETFNDTSHFVRI